MSFFSSLFKPKEPPKNVYVEEAKLTRLGEPYFKVTKQTLPVKELAKMEVVKDYSDPPPYKNVKRRFTNSRAKITYREVYVTPERAAEIRAERERRKKENEDYESNLRKQSEKEERRREEARKAANNSLGRQLDQFVPRGGKRKTRRVKRKIRKTRRGSKS